MLLALDLSFMPKTQDLSTDQGNEKTQMKAGYLQEKESTQSCERGKLIKDLQQSILLKGNWYHYIIGTSCCMVLLLALDLAVIPKAKNLLTDEGLEKTTKTREEESTISNSENIGILKYDINLVITCVLSELKDQLEGSFDDHHDISLSSTNNSILYYKVYLLLMKFFIVAADLLSSSAVTVDNQKKIDHSTLTLELREKDKQIEELKQSLKGN